MPAIYWRDEAGIFRALELEGEKSRWSWRAPARPVHVRFKFKRCGGGCAKCPHGPYVYVTWDERAGGRRVEKFLGRAGGANLPSPPAGSSGGKKSKPRADVRRDCGVASRRSAGSQAAAISPAPAATSPGVGMLEVDRRQVDLKEWVAEAQRAVRP